MMMRRSNYGADLKHALTLFLLIALGTTVWGQEEPETGSPVFEDAQGNTYGPKTGSQVLEDSEDKIYGPKTTQWISESNIFFGKNRNYQPVDTAVRNYHYWTYNQHLHNLYKDLGNIGTALYPIFPQLPSTIGVSTGFNAYAPYFDTQNPVYFDTRSPYTKLQLVWAGNGRAISDIKFSRNINSRWNAGFDFRPILIDKQIQRQQKGDRQTTSYYYDAYTSYHTQNNRYYAMFNYRHIAHLVVENGGVIPTTQIADPYRALFDPNNQPQLTTANTEEVRSTIHLFQQYTLLPKRLSLYYEVDFIEKMNFFRDSNIGSASADIYDAADLLGEQQSSAHNETRFLYWIHKVGAKGHVNNFFHNIYFKARPYELTYKYLTGDTLAIPFRSVEYYLGGDLAYDYDSLNRIRGWAEFLTEDTHNVGVEITSKWAYAKITRTVSKPPFVYNAYRGRFDFWNNQFLNREMTQVELFGKAHLLKDRVFLSAGFTFTDFQNYIYFKKSTVPDAQQTVLPVQSSGKQTLFSPELRADIKLPLHFSLQTRVIYSHLPTNDDNAIRVPRLFANTQFSYQNWWFKHHLQVHIGIEVHWKSTYFDLGYDPVIRQFYVQDDILTPSFFLTDVFFNGKIRRGRFFLRYHNLIQAFTESGYLATPNYPGQRNILDFGFEFMLFD